MKSSNETATCDTFGRYQALWSDRTVNPIIELGSVLSVLSLSRL